MQKQILKIFFLLSIFLMLPDFANADWQQNLETNFDIVETFDELQDWSANGLFPSGTGSATVYDHSLLPKKLDGSDGQWDYWNNKYPTPIVETINDGPFQAGETVTNDLGANWEYRQTYVIDGVTYLRLQDAIFGQSVGTFQIGHTLRGLTSGATATITAWPKIIADHGTNKWGSSGKSLMMNLGDNSNGDGAMAGIGAQRMGLFFGDGITGKSGYKKIHIFMMVKFAPTYFGPTGTQADISHVSIFKFFDICSGFTAINVWSTPEDRARVNDVNMVEYGENQTIVNIQGGGLSAIGRVYLFENIAVAMPNPGSDPVTFDADIIATPTMANNDLLYQSIGNDINKIYDNNQAAGEWFGLEMISDIGTMNNSDGTTELYVYNKEGEIKGHYSATGQLKLKEFDHYYNKLTLGGNRLSGTQTSNLDGRFWIDDFIIDDSRIGPTYFNAYQSSSDVISPASPIGLSVE